MFLCLIVGGGNSFLTDLNNCKKLGSFVFMELFPFNFCVANLAIISVITFQDTIMFRGRKINRLTAFTNVFVFGFNFKVVTASRILLTHSRHNFLPLFAVWLNHVTISLISNEVRGFVAGSVVDELVAVSVKKFIVENQLVVCWNDVTSATALQLEADIGQLERHAVDRLGLFVDSVDSLDRFALQFSHGYRVAPCTVRTREKEKKV